jgi:hypothetical protein
MPIIITTSYGTLIPGLDIERIYIEEGLRTLKANDIFKNAYLSLYDIINNLTTDDNIETSINSPTYRYIKEQLSIPFNDFKAHDYENSVDDLIKYLTDIHVLELIIHWIPKNNQYILKKCIECINQITGRKKILIKI